MSVSSYVPPEDLVLPPEIDDYIMSTLLSYDPNSLKTCALVCRASLAASRVYLFCDVTIENEDMYLRVGRRSPQISHDSGLCPDPSHQ